MRGFWLGSCLAAVGVCGLSDRAAGQSTAPQLEQILKLEAAGEAVDRRASLAEADSLSDTARWQLGQLKHDGQWHSYEDLSDPHDSSLLQEYRAQRDQLSADANGHRRLAMWCKFRHLEEQAKGHWHAVLAFSPDDVQARQALDHKWIQGQWFTPQEREKVATASSKLQAEWAKWLPRLRKITDDICSNSPARTQKGLDSLAKIDDSDAISSMEIICQQLSSDHAAPFIKAIARYRSSAACLACCRIALDRVGEPAGELALKQIKSYPQEMFVPELLGLLREPTQSEVEYQFNSKGELLIHRAVYSETMDEKQLVRLQRLVRVNAPVSEVVSVNGYASVMHPSFNGVSKDASSTAPSAYAHSQIDADEIAAARDALEVQTQLGQRIEQANAELRQTSRKVYDLLTKTTGQSIENSPSAWWSWWHETNERSAPRKPLQNASYSQVDQARVQVNYARIGTFLAKSCLTRGTLVQTESGMRPIESIKIGDLVMSQDVESGELGLKPVLQATIRPPKPTLKIVTEASVIQATAGHRWFVAGKGWLMTKQLEPDMLLHNASGTTQVLKLIEDPLEQETYNLVVDEFHTYFVGPERVLSYDNSELKPTLRAVPGYGQIVAAK